MTTYAEIDAVDTVWLWLGRVPCGEVTLLAGEGGVGKGQLLCDLAARVTTGRPMPLRDAGETPGSVIMITPEDDLSETVAWRLRAAGANLAKVHDLTLLASGSPFELSASERSAGNVAQLREAIGAIGDVRLVVIDPLMACIAYGTIATNLGARRVMAPLQRLAKETGVSIIMSHHTVKSGAIAGSKGLLDAARVVYRVRKDPENPAIRVMALEKSNVLGATEDVRYTLAGEGRDTRVEWLSREALTQRRTSWRRVKPAGKPGATASSALFLAAAAVRSPGDSKRVPLGRYTSPEAAQAACQGSQYAAGLGALQWRQYTERIQTAAAQDGTRVVVFTVARAV